MNEYHRIYAEVNLGAVRYNISNIKNNIPASVGLMPVIKADGYGHGAVEVARAISDFSDMFGVATIEEALELRSVRINKPILILGTLSASHFEEAILNNISVNVYTKDIASKLSEAACRLNKKACIHIAVDTGMNRIGLSCNDDGAELAYKISSYPNLYTEGVFSHFATADEEDKTSSHLQREKFDSFCGKIMQKGVNPKYIHICNSAACCDMGDKCYSMVRPGIIIYGLYPSGEVSRKISLKPALELKSHVSYIKTVQEGEGISYGHTFVTDSERVIATIPVGYADGYPRALSNKGRVIIKGQYAPIVGRVCMDQFMVDISHIDGVNIEDTVTLIGKDKDAEITADEIAGLCDTINYEIICGIGKRVPRIYKEEEL